MQINLSSFKSIYKENIQYYRDSLINDEYPVWDYIVISSANNQQKKYYEMQLDKRKALLSKRSKIIVISDEGLKIGSGGSTIKIINHLNSIDHDIYSKKVLLIHSGGDSKRTPQYLAEGKLFSPMPNILFDQSSTLFDEILVSVTKIPSKMKQGMMIVDGDSLQLFDPDFISFYEEDCMSISSKDTPEVGKQHGVFVIDNGYAKKFLHKHNIDSLKANEALDNEGLIDIDTGIVFLGKTVLKKLNMFFGDNYRQHMINDKIRLSLYGDILYPLATDSSIDEFYIQNAELNINDELKNVRTIIWNNLRGIKLKVCSLKNSQYLHIGTSRELIDLWNNIDTYETLGWAKNIKSSTVSDNTKSYESLVTVNNENNALFYLESAIIHDDVKIGNNTIISNIEIKGNVTIPDNVVIRGVFLSDNKYLCMICGIDDNPKEKILFGKTIDETLWDKKLYPVCDSFDEAIQYALKLYDSVMNNHPEEADKWTDKKSMSTILDDTDFDKLMSFKERVKQLIKINDIELVIKDSVPVNEIKSDLKYPLTINQNEWLNNRIENLDYLEKMRLDYYIGTIINDGDLISRTFRHLSEHMLRNVDFNSEKNIEFVKDKVELELPLRVNFAGEWTDTPPYYLENGGMILNAAITINNQKPVKVQIEKTTDNTIILESKDINQIKRFDNYKELNDISNDCDPFILAKCCLKRCGLLKDSDESIRNGFKLSYQVKGIPQGSGLGTSSILAAAIVKACHEFTGREISNQQIYDYVLQIEQMMTSGGGWQDQAGGLTPGIKYITVKPGDNEPINIEYLNLSNDLLNQLNERFVLIYSGHSRRARNILRKVVGNYIGNNTESLLALQESKIQIKNMRNHLLNNDLDSFGKVLADHYSVNKQIDSGCSNELIEKIFESVDDLIIGKMVCGAGGGGFIQALLKKGIKKEELSLRLKQSFPDSDIDIWDAEII